VSADKTISDDSAGRARFVLGANRETASHDGAAQAGGVIGRRIAAFMIDLFIMGILWLVGWMLIIGSLGLLFPLVMLAFAAMPVIYSTILIASEGSATLGMRALGIRVFNLAENGGRPGLPQAFIQSALFYLSLYGTSGLLLVWCLFDDRQRCLHDILSNTEIRRVQTANS